jgi:hypothetical protein
VLDACDTPAVPGMADDLGEGRATSLYSGTAQERYWAIAPYLVRLDTDVLRWVVESLWDEPWGIFVIADVEFEVLRRHFKNFLIVKSPEGEQWCFRFYDPRVLKVFLPTCDEGQLAELFGPLQAFGAADPGAAEISLIRRTAVAPDRITTPPTPAEPTPSTPRTWLPIR